MTPENYRIYRNKSLEIIALLRSEGYKIDIRYDENDKDDPQISFRIRGLRWWFAIWAIGDWSEFYMCDIDIVEPKIAVFCIHDWNMDKFRYSSCNWGIEIDTNSSQREIFKKENEILSWVEYIKKNPMESYASLSYDLQERMKTGTPLWKAYFSHWWFYKISNPFEKWFKYSGSSLMLWYFLKVLSYMDPYVVRREIMDYEKRSSPRYTFSFLCRKNISDPQCRRVWKWYSEWPNNLRRWCSKKLGKPLFDAHWSVSDWPDGIDEKELRIRMFKGIYFVDWPKNKVVIIAGPSGSGKTTITNYLLSQGELGLVKSVSATTRKPRGEEKDGVDYIFLSTNEFEQLIEEDQFLEWEQVYKDKYYGTLESTTDKLLENNNVIFCIDVKGAVNLKEFYGKKALSIFVKPPSLSELKTRLVKRDADTNVDISERLEKAKEEMKYSKKFDIVISNENLGKAKSKAIKVTKKFLKKDEK